MLSDYLKPEYVDTGMAKTLQFKYQNHDPNILYVLKAPVEMADTISKFLREAINPKYKFKRRYSGPRHDAMALTCLRKDATHIRFYIEVKEKPWKPHVSVQPTHCQCCGQRL